MKSASWKRRSNWPGNAAYDILARLFPEHLNCALNNQHLFMQGDIQIRFEKPATAIVIL